MGRCDHDDRARLHGMEHGMSMKVTAEEVEVVMVVDSKPG